VQVCETFFSAFFVRIAESRHEYYALYSYLNSTQPFCRRKPVALTRFCDRKAHNAPYDYLMP